MSSPGDQLASIQTLPQTQQRTVSQKTSRVQALAGSNQPSEIAAQASRDAQLLNQQTASAQESETIGNAVDPSSLVTRRNIAATQNSIFASANIMANQADQVQQRVALDGAGLEPAAGLNASRTSIYAGQNDQAGREPTSVPLPDADKVSEVQDLALAGMEIPSELQVAAADQQSADEATALAETNATSAEAERANSRSLDAVANADMNAAAAESVVPPKKKRFTLADLFRGKTETAKFDESRFGQKKKVLTTAGIPNMRTAALGDNALPGVNVNAMLPVANDLSDDEHGEDDDQPAGLMKLASLSGMARVAPNGLWMQTDQVEVRCLRPQLVAILKNVESHYGRPVVVTSGFRDGTHNRRAGGARHSLHTLCAAADIQVDGISKWELSDYLRSLPGRGGVGTYCHTSSVHIDIGSERDWNWRCRRSKRRG